MNKILKFLAYGLGGAGLLVASFLVFASLGGVPMHTLPVIGGIFPAPEEEAALPPEPATVEAQIEEDRRPPDQVLDSATSPLGAFHIESPWSATQLEALEQSLEAQMAKLKERERDILERERQLDESARHYDRMFTELEVLRESLIDQSDEAEALQAERQRSQQAAEEVRKESLGRAAALYAEGDTEVAAQMLLDAYEARDAGEILSLLDPDRAAELMRAVHTIADPLELRAVQDAYANAR